MTSHSPSEHRRIYLDNAATSWPKCSNAVDAAEKFVRECGATSGRGTYRSAIEADRWLKDARTRLARLIGADSGQAIAICNSGTHALNAALWGILRAGDHVITTGMDHNSLLRPLKNMEVHHGLKLSIVESDASGVADPQKARNLLREETKLIAVGHASNVTGRVQDIAGWSQLAQEGQAALLLDASQTLGYIPIDVTADRIQLLAAAAHKGLRALPGTGLLYVQPELQKDFRPLMFGGTGLASEQVDDAPTWPQCVEVGNLNMPGVVSMAVAAEELLQYPEPLQVRWRERFEQLVEGLTQIASVRLIGFDNDLSGSCRVPVVSVQMEGWDVHDFASVLDTSFGIEARAGWHCAALVHHALGTAESGGTLRLSPGMSTTSKEIEYTLSAFRTIFA